MPLGRQRLVSIGAWWGQGERQRERGHDVPNQRPPECGGVTARITRGTEKCIAIASARDLEVLGSRRRAALP